MLYLAGSIATSAVRLFGRSAPSRSRRVLTFHCAIVSSCNPGDGRSCMVIGAGVHFMEAASKKC